MRLDSVGNFVSQANDLVNDFIKSFELLLSTASIKGGNGIDGFCARFVQVLTPVSKGEGSNFILI